MVMVTVMVVVGWNCGRALTAMREKKKLPRRSKMESGGCKRTTERQGRNTRLTTLTLSSGSSTNLATCDCSIGTPYRNVVLSTILRVCSVLWHRDWESIK